MRLLKIGLLIAGLLSSGLVISQEHSIAREWSEQLLNGIRNDFARPTVHARNLWHSSILMYDLWALVNDDQANTYLMGKTVRGFECPFDVLPTYTQDKDEVLRIAISYGMYTLMDSRFEGAARNFVIRESLRDFMREQGLDTNYTSEDYSNANPAALGVYVANQILAFGAQDNANEVNDYTNRAYSPVNAPLVMLSDDDVVMDDPNRWQPLTLDVFIDQAGNPIPFNTPEFLSPEWGAVTPFALDDADLTVYNRDNFDYNVFHDPGAPPYVDLEEKTAMSEEFLWGFALVSVWGSHLDPNDGVIWDISPGSIGNIPELPNSIAEYRDFYDLIDGGDPSLGHDVNPKTGQPYAPNIVPRADYARVLAEFWADGPDSETPPGHWFSILNYVSDHPEFVRSYRGLTDELSPLEWDVKSYFMMGSAMHDCAVTAWGIKGWYDYLRPVSAIRAMAARGQSTNENFPNYHPAGIPLIDDYIEIVSVGDPLAGTNGENLGKIKLYTWRGPDFIVDPNVDVAGVGWILAQDWWPYQRPSFVTPPFAGFISGHSTFSRAAAEVLTYITGDPFFPGGMAEFKADSDEFLVFERGPSVDVTLQWATYRDASDQTSLSRIWGGIHPPADDIPGRIIGQEIAGDVVELAETIFFFDNDNDGYYSYIDCDDSDPSINPAGTEVCDGRDNNCSGEVDEGLQLYTYYRDIDGDGYGDPLSPVDTCRVNPILGYVRDFTDCDDENASINSAQTEICDGIDNNCSGLIDEDLFLYTYYLDFDNDGFGDANMPYDTCQATVIMGYAINALDCDDNNPNIHPDALEVCDAIDNDCTGRADDGLPTIRYYRDSDEDGYGNAEVFVDTCITYNPLGFIDNDADCDDTNAQINPIGNDIADNGVDEDCSGFDLYVESKFFPNPFTQDVEIHYATDAPVRLLLYDRVGQIVLDDIMPINQNFFTLQLGDLAAGVYLFKIVDEQLEDLYVETVIKVSN